MRHEILDIIDEAIDGELPDLDFAIFEADDIEDLRACHPELIGDETPVELNFDPASIQGLYVAQYRGVPLYQTTMSPEEWRAV
ncbi:hypothetical protein GCM10011348_45970 [Marinobacterium nitratireducens]|uniref:Uncharacterized protein n=1 Tax=Marinobacterium nitratireducens TaxID=518897 RepID=A0A918DZ11_9GAMM|nr:hypothetical protein [Marinobacterium nitratireducens]GGO89073.1 hypothetical protein GCM10011348_45970 [Marinobacterium nitratireducens]